MAFVDQSSALERERRMQQILDRLSTLSEDELNRLDRNLEVQVLIDDTVSSEFPITTISKQTSESNLKVLLSSRIETVRSNLAQILKYTPTDSDIQELIKLRKVYGNSFTSSIQQISQNAYNLPGGTGSLLKVIDTGNTNIISLTSLASSNAINNVQSTILSNTSLSTNTVLSNTAVSSISPSAIYTLGTTQSNIFDFIRSPSLLIPRLTSLFSDDVDSKIKRIDQKLNEISNQDNEVIAQRANSSVSFINASAIEKTIREGLSTPATNPDPISEDGTPYYTYPNNATIRT